MNWRTAAFFAAAILVSFALAFFSWFHSVLSPGIVALGLLPESSPGDLSGGIFAYLVNGVSWLLVFTAGYGLILRRRRLLLGVGAPLSVVLALACRGMALGHGPFVPEPMLFWLFRRGPVSPVSEALYFRLSLFADVICWFVLLWLAYKLIPKWPTRSRRAPTF